MIGTRTGQKGFSLVELMISVGVLLIGILAVLVLFPLGLKESKTMVDESTSAFVARNARSLMEAHPFSYHGTRSDGTYGTKVGQGTASLIQASIGPKGITNVFSTFPVMFPGTVLNGSPLTGFFDCISTPPSNDRTFDRVIDLAHPQYSWDARFTIGGGPGTDLPLTNLPLVSGQAQPVWGTDWHPPVPGAPTGSNRWADYYWSWFSQYFKYYAVQISVYRNYKEIPVGQGAIWLKADPTYDSTDPNRPIYSELILTSTPDINLTTDSYIRVLDDRSDWYKVTQVTYNGGAWTFRLDRPYWGLSLGGNSSFSVQRNSIVATNSLIESFTTILGSQLDDIDSSAISYP